MFMILNNVIHEQWLTQVLGLNIVFIKVLTSGIFCSLFKNNFYDKLFVLPITSYDATILFQIKISFKKKLIIVCEQTIVCFLTHWSRNVI